MGAASNRSAPSALPCLSSDCDDHAALHHSTREDPAYRSGASDIPALLLGLVLMAERSSGRKCGTSNNAIVPMGINNFWRIGGNYFNSSNLSETFETRKAAARSPRCSTECQRCGLLGC